MIPNLNFQVATIAMAVSFALLIANPTAPLVGAGFISSVALFGFMQWLDRKRVDDLAAINKRFEEMKDKIQALTIGRMR